MTLDLLPHDARRMAGNRGLGGFTSGTVSGIRTRRYRALLLSATKSPAGRSILVNGFDAAMEIADADAPRTPRGCPFQAWSLAELLRLDRIVLAEKNDARTQPAPRNI